MHKANILIVDDNEEYLVLLEEALSEQFHIYTAKNLQEANYQLQQGYIIDIALVDENIGNDSGSSWIEQIKSADIHPKSCVLYSGAATEAVILKGLECGADDFLAKPISLFTLLSKLEKLLIYQSKIEQYEHQLLSKENVIYMSATQAAKYMRCMQLIAQLNKSDSIEQIKQNVFTFMQEANLKGCIAFYPIGETATFYHSNKGYCSPVEIEVMEIFKQRERVFSFSNRIIFNHPLASILLLNLSANTVETDIYLEAFSSIIDVVGARVEFITYKSSLLSIQNQLEQVFEKTRKMVEISKHHQQEVMNNIVKDMSNSFQVLNLSENEERYLMKLIYKALKQHAQDDVNFLEVSQLLDQALEKVNCLKILTQNTDEIIEIDEKDIMS
jgi:CheY-like chemotaxis protein